MAKVIIREFREDEMRSERTNPNWTTADLEKYFDSVGNNRNECHTLTKDKLVFGYFSSHVEDEMIIVSIEAKTPEIEKFVKFMGYEQYMDWKPVGSEVVAKGQKVKNKASGKEYWVVSVDYHYVQVNLCSPDGEILEENTSDFFKRYALVK